MGRKAFFLESKVKPFEFSSCDKCGECFSKTRTGKMFWNPNPRAIDRNICQNCYDVFMHEKQEKYRLWKEKFASLQTVEKNENE